MAISYSMPQLNYNTPATSAFNFGGSGYNPTASNVLTGLTGNTMLDATASLPAINTDYNPQYGNNSGFDWSGLSGGSDNDGAGSMQNSLGMNIPTFQLGLSGLSTIGTLWGAFQSSKLANQQFDYTKQITDKNLANQTQTYNTALSDRANARASMEGWTSAETQDYINKNKLSS